MTRTLHIFTAEYNEPGEPGRDLPSLSPRAPVSPALREKTQEALAIAEELAGSEDPKEAP